MLIFPGLALLCGSVYNFKFWDSFAELFRTGKGSTHYLYFGYFNRLCGGLTTGKHWTLTFGFPHWSELACLHRLWIYSFDVFQSSWGS